MIRRNHIAALDITTSCIGFGCASLGSRIAPAAGLRALEAAFAEGVTWFDVAPPYGAGDAEALLGRFLAGKRDRVTIVTKAGLAPPQRSGLMKSVYAIARPAVGLAKDFRKYFRRIPSTRNTKLPLGRDMMMASLERSLTRLNTDHVDVFALHDPGTDDVGRDEIVRTLEDILRSGKARSVAVAGRLDAGLAALKDGLPFRLVQTADDPVTKPIERLAAAASRPFGLVTHSIFGVDGTKDRLIGILKTDPAARKMLAAAGYDGTTETAVGHLLLDRAFATNPEGVVLASMFSDSHRSTNLDRARRPLNMRAMSLVDEIFASHTEATH